MRGRITEVIQAYRANPPPLPEDEVTEALHSSNGLPATTSPCSACAPIAFRTATSPPIRSRAPASASCAIPRSRCCARPRTRGDHARDPRLPGASPQALIITKANVKCRVHRRVYLDYVGVKLFTPDGRLEGELRIVGLFTSNAYTGSAATDPLSAPQGRPRRPARRLRRRELFRPRPDRTCSRPSRATSCSRSTTRRSSASPLDILQLTERPRIRALARVDEFDRFVSVLVFIPKDRYDTQVRRRVGEFLARIYRGPRLGRLSGLSGRAAGAHPLHHRPRRGQNPDASTARRWKPASPPSSGPGATGSKDALDRQKAGPARPRPGRPLRRRLRGGLSRALLGRRRARRHRACSSSSRPSDRPRAVDLYRREGDPATRVNLKVFSRGAGDLALGARAGAGEHGLPRRQRADLQHHAAARRRPTDAEARVWLHDMTLERADGGADRRRRARPGHRGRADGAVPRPRRIRRLQPARARRRGSAGARRRCCARSAAICARSARPMRRTTSPTRWPAMPALAAGAGRSFSCAKFDPRLADAERDSRMAAATAPTSRPRSTPSPASTRTASCAASST